MKEREGLSVDVGWRCPGSRFARLKIHCKVFFGVLNLVSYFI